MRKFCILAVSCIESRFWSVSGSQRDWPKRDSSLTEAETHRQHIAKNYCNSTARINLNYFFADAGAKRAAILYSLVATCKLHDIDPYACFADVLSWVSTHPANRIDELLPIEWKNRREQVNDLAA